MKPIGRRYASAQSAEASGVDDPPDVADAAQQIPELHEYGSESVQLEDATHTPPMGVHVSFEFELQANIADASDATAAKRRKVRTPCF